MKFRMPSLSRSRKAQFFILSAFAMVTVMFFISQWIEPFTLPETASIVLIEEPFLFNNLVEKAMQTVVLSKDCESLNYAIDEFRNYARDYALSKNLLLNFTWSITSCSFVPATVDIKMRLKSANVLAERNFSCEWFSQVPLGLSLSQPSVTVYNNVIDLIVRGTDNSVWENTFNGNTWSGWVNRGGNIIAQPGLRLSGSDLRLYYHSNDGNDYVRIKSGSNWGSAVATKERWDPGPTYVSYDRFYNFITRSNQNIHFNVC